jgi:hypothetical protein
MALPTASLQFGLGNVERPGFDADEPLPTGCTFENGIVRQTVGKDDGKPAFRGV